MRSGERSWWHMIRFGHSSDWHLTNSKRRMRRNEDGISIRLLDTVDNIHKMIRFLDHHEADFLLVCGDIFDSTPDEVTREKFAEILGALMWSNLTTIFTIGQHDIGRRDHFLEAFQYVVDTYPLEFGDITVADTLSRHTVISDRGTDVNLIVQPWDRKIDPRLWRGFMEDGEPNILMGHFGVLGGLLNSSFRSDKGIPPQAFEPFDYVALGDYHNPDQPFYSGSIARVTFAERDQRKGFRFVTMTDKGKVKKIEFVDVHDRPFVQVDATSTEGLLDFIKANEGAAESHAILKVTVRGTSDEVSTFARTQEEQFRKDLVEWGVADVIVNYETENIERETRVEGLEVGVSIDDAIDAYVEKHPPSDGNLKTMEEYKRTARAIVHEVRGSTEGSDG